jgi:hypothetical protein
MERLVGIDRKVQGSVAVDRDQSCLHCGHPVRERPRGCKAGHCPNCRHPYPLGNCSDWSYPGVRMQRLV